MSGCQSPPVAAELRRAPPRGHRRRRLRRARRREGLRRADVEVTLVDRKSHHLFQPLLYQVAAGGLSEGQIALPDPGAC